jgi:hypothetical protein
METSRGVDHYGIEDLLSEEAPMVRNVCPPRHMSRACS